jgi:hypothetical protein
METFSRETVIDKYTKFPYNLSYERNKNDSIALDIVNKEKLDSSNVVWGYLKNPSLKDTIIIKIEGAKDKTMKKKVELLKYGKRTASAGAKRLAYP